jgi:hypothetical protein
MVPQHQGNLYVDSKKKKSFCIASAAGESLCLVRKRGKHSTVPQHQEISKMTSQKRKVIYGASASGEYQC